MRRLKRVQPELNITDRDVRNVAIAGLCHDLGHGPFSHLFDNLLIREMQIARGVESDFWTHEDASIMMLHDIIETHPHLRE